MASKKNSVKLDRSNLDRRKLCTHGLQLIDFCKTNSIFIFNGRMITDKTGKATTTKGSLIDYMLASPVIISKTDNILCP